MRRVIGTLVVLALIGAGCGGSGGGSTRTAAVSGIVPAATGPAGAEPPAAGGETKTATGGSLGAPAATEASPGTPPEGPNSSGSLSASDQAAVRGTVAAYIAALDGHDAGRLCSLLAPRSLALSQLPRPRSGCLASLRASIGVRPRDGGPAWRKTALVEVKTERLGPDRARAVATVTHHFSDRKYVSVEDDVIYLERFGGGWRLAKPSGTLYRAVGYPDPPLSALTPPPGW
jgi:hypothetical protein